MPQKNKIYFINYESVKLSGGDGRYAASSKARDDIKSILLQRQDIIYRPVVRKSTSTIKGGLELFIKLLFSLLTIPRGSKVFIQYPMIDISIFKIISFFFSRYQVTALIHDLPSYRYDDIKKLRYSEISILNKLYAIIVHSESMKEVLKSDGVKTKMVVLGMFDYLLNDNQKCKFESNSIVFAGALEKSLFLKQLHSINLTGISFNLYGRNLPNIPPNDNIRYKGSFLPDEISTIKGEWGLLWDGISTDNCEGNFGNYLTLIAPHKFSLYVACELKIIVWEKSAMAEFVQEKKLGIVVSSLNQISEKISSLSEIETKTMSDNIHALSKKIREGDMFINAFNRIVS